VFLLQLFSAMGWRWPEVCDEAVCFLIAMMLSKL